MGPLVALALIGTGCDMPMVAIEVEFTELCVTRGDLAFNPAFSGAMEHAINLDELDLDLIEGATTTFEMQRAGFAAADLESLAFLDRVELELQGLSSDGTPLPRTRILDNGLNDDNSAVEIDTEFDPPIDVTEYWNAEQGQLLITVAGQWTETWTASLDLCLDVTAEYAIGWQ